MNAVNEECHGRGEEDEFVIHKRELSQTPEALAAVGDCRRPKSKSTRKGLDSPWKSSWEVWVKDMYLYDFKFNPPSTESQERQFREWLAKGTHEDYQRWINEPLGTIEPPENIDDWIFHSPTRYT